MAYGMCAACGEDGVKTFSDVCTICRTSQKQYKKQRKAESDEAYQENVELAGKYPWLSIPVGVVSAIAAFMLTYEPAGVLWGAVIALIAGGLGYVYSLKILGLIVLIGVLVIFAG
tara:strand:+ start:240 stop:584 length:345 start_codon:yes stop_codon:yes gene_type:complete